MANKGGGGGGGGRGDCDEMTKIWYPVLPGQPRSNVGWDFPAKKAEIAQMRMMKFMFGRNCARR